MNRILSAARSFRERTGLSSWVVLILPSLLWIAASFLLLLPFDQSDPEETGLAAIVILLAGLVFVAALSAMVFALLLIHEDEDDEGFIEVDSLRELVPQRHLDDWDCLAEKFGDEQFATWMINQIPLHGKHGDILQRAREQFPSWSREGELKSCARHEAAHAVVGITLGQIPIYAVVREEDEGVDGLTHFFDRGLELVPVNDCWDLMRVSAAGLALTNLDSVALSGTESDLQHLHEEASELVARARRPEGYTGELSIEEFSRQACREAEHILELNSVALEAIASELETRKILGGYELLKIFQASEAKAL